MKYPNSTTITTEGQNDPAKLSKNNSILSSFPPPQTWYLVIDLGKLHTRKCIVQRRPKKGRFCIYAFRWGRDIVDLEACRTISSWSALA